MTLTHAEGAEVAVDRAVDVDPAQVLGAAARDGLLTYQGYVSGERYEVRAFGQTLILPEAEVLGFVQRLRAVKALARAGVDVELVALRQAGSARGGFLARLRRQEILLPAEWVLPWCDGYRAVLGRPVPAPAPSVADTERIESIAVLFEGPSADDACRMAILGQMYGREGEAPVTTPVLAERAGLSKRTVVVALGFGHQMSSAVRDQMLAVFDLAWSAKHGRVERISGRPVGSLPEMPGMLRLRRIVEAVRAGWVVYLDKPNPNDARRLRAYTLRAGHKVFVIGANDLVPWLDGVAAYYRA